jgi:hypothetical protein
MLELVFEMSALTQRSAGHLLNRLLNTVAGSCIEIFDTAWQVECQQLDSRFVQRETGKVVLKIACMTDVIVCMVCEGGDLELPIHGVGTPAARIGTWETVRQDNSALASVH